MGSGRRVLSIRQYAGVFAGFTILMFVLFGGLTWYKFNEVRSELGLSKMRAAAQELALASDQVLAYAREAAAGFAAWQEVRQQINVPHYYAYWRSVRMQNSEAFPVEALDAEVYDAAGRVLAMSADSTLPSTWQELPHAGAVELWQGEPTLVMQSAVTPVQGSAGPLGYVALRIRLLPLLQARTYRFVDAASLTVDMAPGERLAVDDLASAVRFQLREDPMAAQVESLLQDAIFYLAAIICVLSLLFYPILVYLVGKPLYALSEHIDRVKDTHGDLTLEGSHRLVRVAEVEKIRQSLNDYQAQLNAVHTSLDEKNRQLWQLAHHDALTGVHNRRAFDSYWRSVAENFSGLRFGVCLALFDVNHFKAINDSYGHPTGDKVLKAIAGCLQGVLRHGEQLYRLGGDEFATVLIDCDRDAALHMAERCQQAVAEYPFHRIGLREPVRVSIGLAHAPSAEPLLLQALQWQADMAMYHAKRPGRSHIAMFNDDMADSAQGMFSTWVNNALFEAITHGTGLTMFYQPVVALQDRTVMYYEALVRIRHGDEWIMPGHIYPVVETRRLDADLDRAIFRRILEDVREQRLPPGCGVSINVAGPTLSHAQITDWLAPFCDHMDQHRFVLELTETALITHLGLANDVLGRLRAMGFEIALDDFGSGYSSVRYLANMPVDVVKFDISLIRMLEQKERSTIVLHLARMILESGYRMVAEGIETEAQLQLVREAGFAYGQGWLFGRPSALVAADERDRKAAGLG